MRDYSLIIATITYIIALTIIYKCGADVQERNSIIRQKNELISELMAENKEYKKLYWDSRARQDEGE